MSAMPTQTERARTPETLDGVGEFALIRRLTGHWPKRPDVAVGVGDDVAVVSPEGSSFDFLLTSDAVIEGRHFMPDDAPERIGHKAVARALSDLAAAGGEPLWALIDLAASADTEVARVEGFYRGASATASRYGLALVGGDTAQGSGLQLHVFAVGRVPRGRALLRAGARPGDALYVTGTLGGSRAGRHLDFEPRLAEGQWLRAGGWASAAIDLSDGLASDLRHLCERSGVGARVEVGRLPVSEAARAPRDEHPAWAHAATDGEDFELLFSVHADRAGLFEQAWAAAGLTPCARIGEFVPGDDIDWIGVTDHRAARNVLRGFDHFRDRMG